MAHSKDIVISCCGYHWLMRGGKMKLMNPPISKRDKLTHEKVLKQIVKSVRAEMPGAYLRRLQREYKVGSGSWGERYGTKGKKTAQ